MHLRDRRRRDGRLVETLEQLRRLVAELPLEQFLHFIRVGGRYRAEQAAELAGQRLAERARTGRDDLAEFDVGRAQIDERLRDLLDEFGL
jgi:hypothetical protein